MNNSCAWSKTVLALICIYECIACVPRMLLIVLSIELQSFISLTLYFEKLNIVVSINMESLEKILFGFYLDAFLIIRITI